MAFVSKTPGTIDFKAVMLVVVLALMVSATNNCVDASSMTVWSGPGCNNQAERYDACGCSEIRQHGGYEFEYGGQTAATYNAPNCQGVAHTHFKSNAGACNPFGWMSIFTNVKP